MEKSSFFNSINGDRRHKADDFASYFSSFIGNGVFPLPSTGLQVAEGEGMTVKILAGKAWINGYYYVNTGELPITLQTADGVLDRIDRFVLRWSLLNRSISIKIKSSSFSEEPATPMLQRDADVYEMCLGDVYISHGVTSILQGNITDRRLDSSVCGIVTGTVQHLDTSAFAAQLQSWFLTLQRLSSEQYNQLAAHFHSLESQGEDKYLALQLWFDRFKAQADEAFMEWFLSLQNMLDENAETNLLNRIYELTERVARCEAELASNLTANPFVVDFHSMDGLTATGYWNEEMQCLEC